MGRAEQDLALDPVRADDLFLAPPAGVGQVLFELAGGLLGGDALGQGAVDELAGLFEQVLLKTTRRMT